MRSGKRALAGVAAGALALGALSFVGASGAQATTGTATTTPMRVTFTGTTQDVVEPATLSVPTAFAAANFYFDLQVAPAGGIMTVGDATGDDTQVALVGDDTIVNIIDDTVSISAQTAGTYAGRIFNGTDTATFSVTSTGAPASLTLTPATATVAEGGAAIFTVKLLDASGAVTQPTTVDSVSLTASGNGSPASTTLSGSGSFSDGSATQAISLSSGSSTITATPLGTLPSSGVTAQTASLTASGTVQSTPVKTMDVSTPSNAINDLGSGLAHASQVPAGTTSLVIDVDDDTGATSTAGANLLFEVASSAGTVNGVGQDDQPVYVAATVGSDEKTTLSLTLGAGAQVATEYVTITQVKASTAAVTPATSLTVTQETPAVYTSGITVSPSGDMVGKFDTAIPVTVTVDDSFGNPQSGWTVTAYNSSTPGASAFISNGVTNSSGEAALTVLNSSGVPVDGTETYYFQAVSATGQTVGTSGVDTLAVKWTESGEVTTLSVAPSGATACSNTSCTLLIVPEVVVPSDGVVDGSATGGLYTLATETSTGTARKYATFPITTDPSNPTTVTTPEGVYVASTIPSTTEIAWNAGKNSAVINGGQSAYIWGTKTGLHDVTFTSGGVTITAKVYISNVNTDAYNIALSPASQVLGASSYGTITVTVTDVFGNPVGGATGTGNGGVTLTATGEVLFGGLTNTTNVTTGADGTFAVSLIAGNSGSGTISAGPQGGSSTTTPAWISTFTPPAGAPAPVTSAAASVTVTSSSTKSITITGERTTVKGKPGIMVDGLTTGFAEGDLTVPHIKFPGQTSYSEGSARPAIDADGEFSWQRKTGKKIYIYFSNEDGSVKSDRIIIQAK